MQLHYKEGHFVFGGWLWVFFVLLCFLNHGLLLQCIPSQEHLNISLTLNYSVCTLTQVDCHLLTDRVETGVKHIY